MALSFMALNQISQLSYSLRAVAIKIFERLI